MEPSAEEAELFRCEQSRWLMLAGAIMCAAGAAAFARVATVPFRWPSFLIAGPIAPSFLFASFRLVVLFRNPHQYSIEVTSRGIGQPEAPGSPSLAWNEVTRVAPSVWGGFWLSGPTASQRVRVWSEVPRFVELLDIVLDRGSIASPPVPLVVAPPRWLKVASWIARIMIFALFGGVFFEHGSSRLFWLLGAALAWVFYADWRGLGRVARQVEIGPDAVRLSSREGDTLVSWDSVADVRLLPARQGGLSSLLVRRDGTVVEVPPIQRREALRVYQALRMRGGSQPCAAASRTPNLEFAASRRRQVMGALVAGLIAGLSIAAAKTCGRARRGRGRP
jgi:hypothetical protein